MPRTKLSVCYFECVKAKAVRLRNLEITSEKTLSSEQSNALEEFKAAAASYLVGDHGYKINRKGITTLRQNGFEAMDISEQPSNANSEGIRHVGALVRIGELIVFIER